MQDKKNSPRSLRHLVMNHLVNRREGIPRLSKKSGAGYPRRFGGPGAHVAQPNDISVIYNNIDICYFIITVSAIPL